MMGWLLRPLLLAAALAIAVVAPAHAIHNDDQHSDNASLLFESPNATGATNSDLAFWGDRAYAGNYDGFRIFDVSDPANPAKVVDFQCPGPQSDPIVWRNELLFLAVDSVLTGPECGSEPAEDPEDPDGWEGVRIFDISDPENPEFVKGVFTDCGAHTITLFPKNKGQVLIYVSSYSLRPGPTCGPTRGPETGNSPLHEKISVIRVPTKAPHAARVAKQPKISYPGDPDNRFVPAEHGAPDFDPLTACHDIGVLVEKRMALGACAEQAQMWRIKPNGMPDTENPLWVFDDEDDANGITGDPADDEIAVDFWHSATFSWDGAVVNLIDESFGNGCPPTTPAFDADTGRMFFLDAGSGQKLSHFMLPRPESALDEGQETAYCSAHMGVPVAATDQRLLVNAWYMGGMNVVDFTDPTDPQEVAFYDIAPPGPLGSDNWSAYWYEGPSLPGDSLTIYGSDGVHNPPTGRGFQVFRVDHAADEVSLDHLNPQTQDKVIQLSP